MRTATLDDLPALRELFSRASDAPYDLALVAEEKCFGAGAAGAPLTRVVEREGGIAAAAVTCGRWLRILVVDRDTRRRGIGSALLADAESRGVTAIAAEAGNYFTPGVMANDETSQAFLRARGYVKGAETMNLEVDLATIGAADGEEPRRPSHEEIGRVLAFVEREFGRIWRLEAARAFERDVPSIVITESGGDISGFAAHDVNNRGLGFFGPTGVAQSMRGRGLGCRLVRASLADLRTIGYSKAVIPWTDALDFYRRCCGAEAAHRFVAFARSRP